MSEVIETTSEPILPPVETWESGLQQANELALQLVEQFDGKKKILQVDPADREGGGATPEEIKLAIGVLVAKRMVIEMRADLMFNTMVVSKARVLLAGHPTLPRSEKLRVMEALQIKEGMGVRLSTAWRIIELTLRQWQKPNFWHPGRDPVKEARKLFLAINGLEEVKQPTEVQSGNEDKKQEDSGTEGQRGSAEGVRTSPGEDQVGGQGPREEGPGGVSPAEGVGRGPGSPHGEDQSLQGVQEAPGQEDQGDGGQDCCHPPRA